MDRSDQGVHSKLIPGNRIPPPHSGLLHHPTMVLLNQDRRLVMEEAPGMGSRSIFTVNKG
jgi:hypothetical protein